MKSQWHLGINIPMKVKSLNAWRLQNKSLPQPHGPYINQKSNTIKYLVSCTPIGLVNYMSPTNWGIRNTCLVESCDLQPVICYSLQGIQLYRTTSQK